MSLLEIKNLNLTYPNGKKIFENAEITLQPGESQALWSPNGTGKTSLFRVVTGLLKPQTADIFLEDKAVTNEEEFNAPDTLLFSQYYYPLHLMHFSTRYISQAESKMTE